jgi:hypothetical protein
MADFIAGQKVKLVRDFEPDRRTEAPSDGILLPVLGETYTVRKVGHEPDFGSVLFLEEIVNETKFYLDAFKVMEQGFDPTRFQLVDPAPSPRSEPADLPVLMKASLPTTSRLSQLEARKSCAASINEPSTLSGQPPKNHALGSCDHRPHPPAPQSSDQQPDRHDHSKSTTTDWACDLALGEQSEFRHQVAGNETDSKSDPEREKQQLVEVAQDGNEVRDEIDRRESIGSYTPGDQLGRERRTLIPSGDPECDRVPFQGFRPAFQSLEPALHTLTYIATAEETVNPTRPASPAPETNLVSAELADASKVNENACGSKGESSATCCPDDPNSDPKNENICSPQNDADGKP